MRDGFMVVATCLAFALCGGTAGAQGMPAGEALAKVKRACSQNPDHEACKKVKDLCIRLFSGTSETERQFCRDLKYTPALNAAEQISELASKCESNDLDDGCVALRTQCRESRVECGLVRRLACHGATGGYCDSTYLCAPSATKKLCSGTSEAGSKYQLVHLDYTSVDAGLGSSIFSLGSTGRFQTGESKIGMCTIADMAIGWLKGQSGLV